MCASVSLPALRAYRPRQRVHPCRLYIRRVRGFKYQLRWSLPNNQSVNCGLYTDEATAELVRRAVASESAHHPQSPLGLWDALQVVLARLKKTKPGIDLPEVLPKYVRACTSPLGPVKDKCPNWRWQTYWVLQRLDGYRAEVRLCGKVIRLDGPYSDPRQAHVAMLGVLNQPAMLTLRAAMERRALDRIEARARAIVKAGRAMQAVTDRREVRKLQRGGYYTEAISEDLSISAKTVWKHLCPLTRRRQAAALRERGLSPSDVAEVMGIPKCTERADRAAWIRELGRRGWSESKIARRVAVPRLWVKHVIGMDRG